MGKFLRYSFLFSILAVGLPAHAQMMGGGVATATDTTQTAQDEAAGKAVWDRLQNGQVACKDITDDDFDVLGDFFMGNMMGANHASMNAMMAQRLGDDGEKRMHITMGKRLSGCDTAAVFPQGAGYFTPMMGLGTPMVGNSNPGNTSWGGGGNGNVSGGMMGYGNAVTRGFSSLFEILIGIAVLTFLLLGSLFFWRGIQKK